MSYEHDDVGEILVSDTKGIEFANDELTWLFRNVMMDVGATPMSWDLMMERYLNDPSNNIPLNGKERSSYRGNLNKELLKHSTMTWKVFKRGLKFLGALKFRLELQVTWRNKTVTVYGGNVFLVRESQLPPKEVDTNSK